MTIKELREKYNLTQSALARSLGVSSNAISGIEAGRIKLSPKMSARIKEVYGEEVAPAVPATEKKATPKKKAEEAAAPVEAPVEEKAPAKKVSQKKAPEKKPAPKKAPAKKSAPKKAAAATPTIILQSPLGGEVSAEEILSKVGDVDKVYVRIDQNKLYWVKGDEAGDKDIW